MTCICTSPPGEPKAINGLPSRIAIAGSGVSRGRLPGSMDEGWPAMPHPAPLLTGTAMTTNHSCRLACGAKPDGATFLYADPALGDGPVLAKIFLVEQSV
jgi:hypothetical protein